MNSIAKSQTHSWFSLTLFLTVMILVSSCGKQTADPAFSLDEKLELMDIATSVQSLSTDLATKEGALHFTDTANFFSQLEKIMELSDVEFKEFEKSVGFKSLSTVLEEAYKAFDELETESDLQAWKDKYGDVVELRDSIVTPLIQQPSYQRLANRLGEYYIHNTYVKITERQVALVVGGDKRKLKGSADVNSSDVKNGVIVYDLPKTQRVQEKESDGSMVTSQEIAKCNNSWMTAMRQEGKRKVFIDFFILPTVGPMGTSTKVEVVAKGHKKTLFGWNKYKTRYHIKTVNYELIDARGNRQDGIDLSKRPGFNDEYQLFLTDQLSDVVPSISYTLPDSFIRVSGRAHSRGTNPYWAVVCCVPVPYSCPTDYEYIPAL